MEYGGHLLKGAALTTGETTEQTNSRMSRYSNTRNMGQPSMNYQTLNLFIVKMILFSISF